jgi:hypothetical protein
MAIKPVDVIVAVDVIVGEPVIVDVSSTCTCPPP